MMTGLSLILLAFQYFQLVSYRVTTLEPIKQFCEERARLSLTENKKPVDDYEYVAKCSWPKLGSDLNDITLFERRLNSNFISTAIQVTIPLIILVFMSVITRRLLMIDYTNKSN